MKETYSKWYSADIGQETEMLVFGHAGYPVIVFPTSMGKFYQNKDFKLIEAASWFIEQGLIRIYCPDSIDSESWYNKNIHPSQRVLRHIQYEKMILNDVVSKAISETGSAKVVFAGCSFGAYHATNIGLRNPSVTSYIFNMGGAFDITMHLEGYHDQNVFFNNPPEFLPGLNDPELNKMGIVFGTAEHDFCIHHNFRMSDILTNKGIPHWLDVRNDANHDWPVWREQFAHYLGLLNYNELNKNLKNQIASI